MIVPCIIVPYGRFYWTPSKRTQTFRTRGHQTIFFIYHHQWASPVQISAADFGGMYQQDDCNKNNVVNDLTGALTCPPGYTSARILRIKAPESNCGAWQNFCYKSDQTPVGFGGMYQIDDFGSVYAGNPLNAGQTSCPAGFNSHHMERSLHPEKGVGDNLFICLPSFIQDQSKIGGFYQVNDVEVVNNVDNPFTGGRSCPVNYRAVQVGRIKTPEGQQAGANVYICLLLA